MEKRACKQLILVLVVIFAFSTTAYAAEFEVGRETTYTGVALDMYVEQLMRERAEIVAKMLSREVHTNRAAYSNDTLQYELDELDSTLRSLGVSFLTSEEVY